MAGASDHNARCGAELWLNFVALITRANTVRRITASPLCPRLDKLRSHTVMDSFMPAFIHRPGRADGSDPFQTDQPHAMAREL